MIENEYDERVPTKIRREILVADMRTWKVGAHFVDAVENAFVYTSGLENRVIRQKKEIADLSKVIAAKDDSIRNAKAAIGSLATWCHLNLCTEGCDGSCVDKAVASVGATA